MCVCVCAYMKIDIHVLVVKRTELRIVGVPCLCGVNTLPCAAPDRSRSDTVYAMCAVAAKSAQTTAGCVQCLTSSACQYAGKHLHAHDIPGT